MHLPKQIARLLLESGDFYGTARFCSRLSVRKLIRNIW